MCRWLAYLGSPIPLEDALVRPEYSLIDQSLLARDLYLPGVAMAAQFPRHAFPTNGDGFGIAWAGRAGSLGQYRQLTPAWDSQNLRSLAAQIVSGCFLAHVPRRRTHSSSVTATPRCASIWRSPLPWSRIRSAA